MANKHAKAKNLRARALVSLVAIIVVVAVCAYLGLCGFGKGTMINYLKPWGDAISLGLDLRGGVYTVYQAENNGDPDFDTKTVSILTSRLTRQGFTEATVTRQGSDRIRVEIPNVSDPNQILTIIGTPAQLYFVDESGNNLMEGGMVKNAQAAQDQDGKPCIAFELTDEGAKIFAEATAANLGKTISITLDGETISRATVNTVIAGGKGEITGNFTADEAKNLATLILSGALPLNLTQLEVSAISATLGVEALDRAIQAGIIGVALVMMFMLFRYRLCGLVADIALTIYIMIVVLLLALTALLAAILLHLRPMLENLATARCANTVSRIVVAAVNDAVENGWMEYDRLVKFDKDSDGRVTALSSNMAEFNRLQTAVADDVLARLSQVSASELAVPLGTLTGSPLLAGRGPKLTVKMETIGTATAKFRDKFTAAGINQTKHQILLDVDVRVSILLPGITTYTKVSNEISVAETVIVGGVPQTYTYFSTTEDKIEDYADEYIMNNG